MRANSKSVKKNRWSISEGLKKKLSAAAKPPPPAKGLKFVNGKFRGVSLKTAPMVLISEEASFYGHKEIIFAGLCAWVLNSADGRSSQAAIAQATAGRIVAAEKSKRLKAVPPSARPFMSWDVKYKQLFQTIYYPIGGLSALVRAVSSAPIRDQRRKASEKEIRYLVAMAAILDLHARNFSGGVYGKPSIKKASVLAGLLLDQSGEPRRGKLSSKQRGKTVVHEYLKAHRGALAFLYAADRINFEDGASLLDQLLRGSLKYRNTITSAEGYPSRIELWFSYATHFSETVLAALPGYKVKSVGWSKAAVPPLREFTPAQVAKVKEVLSEKAPSEKRLQF